MEEKERKRGKKHRKSIGRKAQVPYEADKGYILLTEQLESGLKENVEAV